MKFVLLTIMIALCLVLTSCAENMANRTETALVKADTGFIKIHGNTANISVFINDVQQSLIYKKNIAIMEIPSGTYNISIQRDGRKIIDQKIAVSAGNTTEVKVP
jgi:hypothetical protein